MARTHGYRSTEPPAVILGIGNVLLSDDGIGVHVVNRLRAMIERGEVGHPLTLCDGGTIGLSLISEIDSNAPLIAIDAMELNAPAGTVRVFQCEDMDRQLMGSKRTAHEVALADLMQAARLLGCGPEQRALVAIQPATTTWGMAPTPEVADAIAVAVQSVLALLDGWAGKAAA